MFKRGKSSVLLAVELVEGKVTCVLLAVELVEGKVIYVLAVELRI